MTVAVETPTHVRMFYDAVEEGRVALQNNGPDRLSASRHYTVAVANLALVIGSAQASAGAYGGGLHRIIDVLVTDLVPVPDGFSDADWETFLHAVQRQRRDSSDRLGIRKLCALLYAQHPDINWLDRVETYALVLVPFWELRFKDLPLPRI